MNIEREICESATGIRQRNGIDRFYNSQGNEISIKEAKQLFRRGEVVEVPNAGAGSFREVLKTLGYEKVDVDCWSSSAGDWSFKIRGHYVYQENRYPYHGFRYSLCKEEEG